MSGLQAGNRYVLLRYDDAADVPTSGTAAEFRASSTSRVPFVAAGPEWTLVDPVSFRSDGVRYYRVVAE